MSTTNDQTITTYDQTVEKYIETTPQKVDGEFRNWIDKNLSGLAKTAKILEIGSGSGKDADYFSSKGYSVELTDASTGFVGFLNSKGKKARLLNAITDELGSGYDMVFADAVLLHFTRDEARIVLRKIYNALNNQGRLVFSLKAGKGDELTDRKLGGNRYFCYWQPQGIKEILSDLRFRSTNIKVIDDNRGKPNPDWILISASK